MPEISEVKRVLVIGSVEFAAECMNALQPTFVVEEVRLASTAMERMGQKPQIQAAVLDLILPNGKGVELVKRFQSRHPDIPVVVLTSQPCDYWEAIEAGAQEFLRKPVSAERFAEAVCHAVSRHIVRMAFKAADAQFDRLKRTCQPGGPITE